MDYIFLRGVRKLDRFDSFRYHLKDKTSTSLLCVYYETSLHCVSFCVKNYFYVFASLFLYLVLNALNRTVILALPNDTIFSWLPYWPLDSWSALLTSLLITASIVDCVHYLALCQGMSDMKGDNFNYSWKCSDLDMSKDYDDMADSVVSDDHFSLSFPLVHLPPTMFFVRPPDPDPPSNDALNFVILFSLEMKECQQICPPPPLPSPTVINTSSVTSIDTSPLSVDNDAV